MDLLVLLLSLLSLARAWPVQPLNTTTSLLSSSRNSTNRLSRRKCDPIAGSINFECDYQLPSLQQIVDEMRNQAGGKGVTASRPSVFYTNLGYPQSIMEDEMLDWPAQWLNEKGLWPDGFYWLYGPWDDNWYNVQKQWIVDHSAEIYDTYPDEYDMKWEVPPQTMFKMCRYHALSSAALHPEAYLFAPKGVEWRKESVWEETEYPALTHNPAIQTIYQVDPQPRFWKEDTGQLPKTPPDQCPPKEEPDDAEIIWSRERGDETRPFKWDCPVGVRDYWPIS